MRAVRNSHIKAAADAIQKRIDSKDRQWCELVAMEALTAAREVDRARASELARASILGEPAPDFK